MSNEVVGIDLGTTNSCIAFINKNGEPEIIENFNDDNAKITPSCVLFEEDKVIVGTKALDYPNQLLFKNVIYEVKRLMGVKYAEVGKEIRTYDVEPDDLGEPRIKLMLNGKTVYKTPVEVSAEILKSLIKYASEKKGVEIKKAVIAIPAYFNNFQREATKEAARLAGVELLQLFHEPTAAALSYIHDKKITEKNLLVYDLGGGTFDVSITKVKEKKIDVVALDGDTRLGGADFDKALVEHIVKKVEADHKLIVDKKSYRRINKQAHNLKERLSFRKKESIILENFQGGDILINIPFTRKYFEGLIAGHVDRTIEITKRCITDSGMDKRDIDEVVLIGGSCKIPMIALRITEFFDRDIVKKPNKPEEAIAKGAALKTISLDQNDSYKTNSFQVLDVIPFSLGIKKEGGIMSVLIKKSTKIPVSYTKCFTTSCNDQRSIRIAIFQGDSFRCTDNLFLGDFRFDGITPMLAREVKIDVTMKLDVNGILEVSAVERSQGQVKNLVLMLEVKGTDCKNRSEKQSDDVFDFVILKNNLIACCQEVVRYVTKDQLDEKYKCVTKRHCNELIRWARKVKADDQESVRGKINEVKTKYKEAFKS